jgi:hypothetical protein
MKTSELLTHFLAEGKNLIGEIVLQNNFSLRHREDVNLDARELKFYQGPKAAREIARYDQEAAYRPLKTAPNLCRGWLLQLNNIEEMALALDFFYPAALNLYAAWLEKKLEITSLRETLNRQTGMYRITQKLNEDQAQSLVGACCCGKNCLRKVLWSIDEKNLITTLPEEKRTVISSSQEIPLLCRELCNLVVAAARTVVKKAESATL